MLGNCWTNEQPRPIELWGSWELLDTSSNVLVTILIACHVDSDEYNCSYLHSLFFTTLIHTYNSVYRLCSVCICIDSWVVVHVAWLVDNHKTGFSYLYYLLNLLQWLGFCRTKKHIYPHLGCHFLLNWNLIEDAITQWKVMSLQECWSCSDTRQCRRCVCRAPVGNSCSCPPQVQEALSTSFYKMCNYYGRQECGFKPSQYVDKRYAHTYTHSWLKLKLLYVV